MPDNLNHFLDSYTRDEDRFFFVSGILEGRDMRVDAAIRERINEIAAENRSSFRVIESDRDRQVDLLEADLAD